jgi:hypothetical protein
VLRLVSNYFVSKFQIAFRLSAQGRDGRWADIFMRKRQQMVTGYSCNHVTFSDERHEFCKQISKYGSLLAEISICLIYKALQNP